MNLNTAGVLAILFLVLFFGPWLLLIYNRIVFRELAKDRNYSIRIFIAIVWNIFSLINTALALWSILYYFRVSVESLIPPLLGIFSGVTSVFIMPKDKRSLRIYMLIPVVLCIASLLFISLGPQRY